MKHNMRTDARHRERDRGREGCRERERERQRERKKSETDRASYNWQIHCVCVWDCVSVCGSNNFAFVWANIVAR